MPLRPFLASVSFGLSLWMLASYFHKPTLLLPLPSPAAAVVTAEGAGDVEADSQAVISLGSL